MSSEATPKASSLRRQVRLLRYAKPHWRALVLLSGTMLLDVGLDLLKPWPLKLVIDNVLGHHRAPHIVSSVLPGSGTPHGLLAWAAIGTVAIFLLGTASTTFYNYFSLRIGQRMVFSLAADLFVHLQRLSLIFHSRRALGDTIQRVTGDSYCISTLVTDALIPVLQALLMLVAMFVVMWSLEPTLTLVALSVLPFLAVVIRYLANPIKDRAHDRHGGDHLSRRRSRAARQAHDRIDHRLPLIPGLAVRPPGRPHRHSPHHPGSSGRRRPRDGDPRDRARDPGPSWSDRCGRGGAHPLRARHLRLRARSTGSEGRLASGRPRRGDRDRRRDWRGQ